MSDVRDMSEMETFIANLDDAIERERRAGFELESARKELERAQTEHAEAMRHTLTAELALRDHLNSRSVSA